MEPAVYSKNNNKLQWIEGFASIMDDKFRIPGTSYRFGLDPILNFIPGLGAVSGFAISGGLLLTMAKHGASGKVLTLMVINIVLDAVIGAIPVLGWIFDFAYKANTRNIKLLKDHYEEGKHPGSGKNLVAIIIIVLILLSVFILFLIWQLIEWVIGLF
ncbi:MAG TPA: DUF4112 domain-containing protein [Sphingobacteriaceae bacterium]|nr:DUF4112 domain-containing protein [Sphingobacteriaceae bacterium]